jgi:hypothetical protein
VREYDEREYKYDEYEHVCEYDEHDEHVRECARSCAYSRE